MEVILVDNCSTDGTSTVARDSWKTLGNPFPLIATEEAMAGLSYARRKGIECASYDYVVFCDDDNRLDPDYLVAAEAVLQSEPRIGMLGGFGTPQYESIPSFWPTDFYIYGCGPQGTRRGPVRTLHGAGVLLRKEAFERLMAAGFRFYLTDRKGNSLSSGGDYELCYAVSMAGYLIWYDDRLRFSHYISADRLTRGYVRRFVKESAPAVDVLDIYSHLSGEKKMRLSRFILCQARYFLHHLKKLIRSAYLKRKYRGQEQLVFLETFHQQYHFQRLWCIIRALPRHRSMMAGILALGERLRQPAQEGKPLPSTGGSCAG